MIKKISKQLINDIQNFVVAIHLVYPNRKILQTQLRYFWKHYLFSEHLYSSSILQYWYLKKQVRYFYFTKCLQKVAASAHNLNNWEKKSARQKPKNFKTKHNLFVFMVDITHKSVAHMVQQLGFDDSMFNIHLEKSEAKILIWEACSSEHMWQGCITSSAPKVLTFKYQTPPAPLWSWFDKNKTSHHGFETLGPFARADQTHAIVGSLCQNAEILLLCALIGSGPVGGKGTHSHSDCQTDETEQRHH